VTPEVAVHVAVQVEPAQGTPLPVEYRWDPDTDILTASLAPGGAGAPVDGGGGTSGSMELEGNDGSWLILDVQAGRIQGVEVAVWPDVKTRATLAPPAQVEDGTVTVPRAGAARGVAALEVDTALSAEADPAERTIHFKVGATRLARTVRIARDILIDLDARGGIAGVWLLNVPPFPDAQ
jgi:uncharacterized protein YuzE